MNTVMNEDLASILLSEETLREKVTELGAAVSRDYEGKQLLVISVLKGSFIFMSDLARKITIPCRFDFMSVSSYGKGTQSSGNVRIVQDLSIDVENRHILVVEDILDSGKTLSHLLDLLGSRNPASVRLCALLDKPSRRAVDVRVDYKGFEIPDEFVVGYGLDYNEKYRNLPYVGILKPEIYTRKA